MTTNDYISSDIPSCWM